MTDVNLIQKLRTEVCSRLGEYRSRHVLSTEEEAARLAKIYMPHKETEVRISALLHDITKEYDVEKQLQIFSEFGIILDGVLLNSPKVFHSHTGALIIRRDFSEYATDEIVTAVKNHTTGASDMSLFDCMLYLADYIEPSRRFDDCKTLRSYFWDGIEKATDEKARLLHLYKTMVLSFDLTIANLINENCVIAADTFSARNAFLVKILEERENERE